MLDKLLNSAFMQWTMGALLLFCVAFWIWYGVWLHRQHLYKGPISIQVIEWGIPVQTAAKPYNFTFIGNRPN